MGIVHVVLIFGTYIQDSTFIYIYIYIWFRYVVMKLWQVLLNKTPNEGGKEEQRENSSLSQKHKNPNES
jgi:hypothetical protein